MKNINKILCLVLSLLLTLAVFSACGSEKTDKADTDDKKSTITFNSVDEIDFSETFYLVDVSSYDDGYYIEVEAQGSGEHYRLPLADDLNANFQDPEWVGAWAPEQYLTASAVKLGFDDGKIVKNAMLTLGAENGKIVYMEEENYYAGNEETEIITATVYTDMSNGVSAELDSELIRAHDIGCEVYVDENGASGLYPVDTIEFSTDSPYMGSAFYYAHAGNA